MRFEAFFLLITLFISLPVMAQDESWKEFTLNELIEQHQQRTLISNLALLSI